MGFQYISASGVLTFELTIAFLPIYIFLAFLSVLKFKLFHHDLHFCDVTLFSHDLLGDSVAEGIRRCFVFKQTSFHRWCPDMRKLLVACG